MSEYRGIPGGTYVRVVCLQGSLRILPSTRPSIRLDRCRAFSSTFGIVCCLSSVVDGPVVPGWRFQLLWRRVRLAELWSLRCLLIRRHGPDVRIGDLPGFACQGDGLIRSRNQPGTQCIELCVGSIFVGVGSSRGCRDPCR
jgi:hypothetical protein